MHDFEKYEFGIIDDLEKVKQELFDIETYYNPKLYNCVKLQEDFWWSFYFDTKNIITLNIEENIEEKGFNEIHVTIVPVKSLNNLKLCVEKQIGKKEKVLKQSEYNESLFDKEFDELIEIIDKAIENSKNMIFYPN